MQPDLLIACDLEDTVTETGRYMGTPTLVVEILSPGTRSRDMVDKLNTYMLSGVRGILGCRSGAENRAGLRL